MREFTLASGSRVGREFTLLGQLGVVRWLPPSSGTRSAASQSARCPRAYGGLEPTERVSDAQGPSHTGAERIASERVSDAQGSTSKGR